MHEQSLMADLFRKLESVSRENDGGQVVEVKIKLGALSHISAGHFRDHFVHSSKGTCAENARLDIETLKEINHPQAQDILIECLELEN